MIEPGDLVAFDTDMVGPTPAISPTSPGFSACPGKAPTGEQRRLYDLAQEQILTHVELIKPDVVRGVRCKVLAGAREVRRKPLHDDDRRCRAGGRKPDRRPTPPTLRNRAYDGVFEEGMVLCVESFIGEVGGREGVKLEEQVLVTGDGAVPMPPPARR